MITDVIVRYTSNINNKNEIANFNALEIVGDGISAVSWELKNIKRSNGTLTIIKEMIEKLSTTIDKSTIYIYIQLSGYQPDTRLIRYKKTWGLLESMGYDVSFVLDKRDAIFDCDKGLILTGTASFGVSLLDKLSMLIKDERKIFFAVTPSQNNILDITNINSELEWMNVFWSLNGIIFLTLGLLDEMDCEVVALGKDSVIEALK